MRPHDPGHRDITSPGVSDGVCPAWAKNTLRRVHVNFGHCSNEALVRLLAERGVASGILVGARGLRCG